MSDFYRTTMGHRFYEGTMPSLVRELQRLNANVEKLVPAAASKLDADAERRQFADGDSAMRNLIDAARAVIENWEKGDLASAVNDLEGACEEAEAVLKVTL